MADSNTRIVISAEDRTKAAFNSVLSGLHVVENAAVGINGAMSRLPVLGGAFAAALGSVSLAGTIIKGAIDAADELNDLSQRMGIAVRDLAAYKLAAEQSGTSLDAVAKGMKGLSSAVVEHGSLLKKAGIDTKDADKAFRQLSDVFAAMPDGMEKAAMATKLFGKAGMDLIPMLNLGSKGLEEAAEKSARYAATMALLAPQADKINDQLLELSVAGQALGANLALSVAPRLTEITGAMAMAAQESGVLKAAWVGFGGLAAQVFNPISAVFKQVGASIHEATAEFNEFMAKRTGNSAFAKTAAEERAAVSRIYREIAALDSTPSPAPAASALPGDSEFAKRIKAQMAELRLLLEGEAKSKPIKIKTSIDAQDMEGAKAYEALFKAIAKAEEDAAFSGMEFSDVQKAMNALQDTSWWKEMPGDIQAAVAAAANFADTTRRVSEESVQAEKRIQEMLEQHSLAAAEEAKDLTLRAVAAEEENSAIVASAEKLQELTRRRYDEQIAIKRARIDALRSADVREEEVGLINDQVESIEKQIAALERLKSADIARPALEQQAQAWQEFTRDIEQSLTDALMRSFEAGDSFGQAFAKNIENIFKTMVLRFAVQAVVGGAGQLLGISTSAGAANAFSTASNLVSGAGGLYQLYAGYTAGTGTGIMGAAGNYLGGLGATGGYYATSQAAANAAMAAYPGATGASVGGVGVGSMSGSTTAGAASGASSAWGSIAAGAGYFLALVALAEWLDGKSGGPKTEGDAFATVGANGPTFSNNWVDGSYWFTGGAEMPNMFNPAYPTEDQGGWQAAINAGIPTYVDIPGARPTNDIVRDDILTPFLTGVGAYVQSLGGSTTGMHFGLGYSVDSQGSAPDQVSASVADANGNIIYTHGGEVGRGGAQKAMDMEMRRMTLAAVDAADINPIFEAIVHGVDLATASAEQLDAAFVKIVDAQKGIDLAKLIGLDEPSYTALLSKTGDIAALNATMAGYYSNFFTADEQRTGMLEAVGKQFDALNLEMPLTKEGFRDLVKGLDQTTDAGLATFNALMGLQPAMLQVADAASQVAAEWAGFDAAGLGQMILDAAFNPAAGMTAAESFALSLEQSVRQALISSTVGSIAQNIFNSIVVPMAAGAAVSQAAITQVTSTAQAAIASLGVVLAELDLTPITSVIKTIMPSLASFAPSAAASVSRSYATVASTQAAESARLAAQVKEEWQSIADAILDTMRELRGEMLSDSQNFAAAQAQFSISTAAARAGDKTAAERLPDLARSVVDLGRSVTVTAIDQALLTARTLASLRSTVTALGDKFGLDIPAFAGGGYHTGGLRLVGEAGPELEATGPARYYNADQLRATLQGDVAGEVRALRDELSKLRTENATLQRAIAGHTFNTAKALQRAMPDGDAFATRAAA